MSIFAQRERIRLSAERERARMLRLKRQRAEGQTLDAAEAVAFFGTLMVEAQESILQMPSIFAPELAETLGVDAGRVEAELERVLRAHVTTLVAGLLAKKPK
jgi:hypothetical protein